MRRQDQAPQFRAHGFLVIDDLLDAETLAAIRAEYAVRVAWAVPTVETGDSGQALPRRSLQ